MNLSPRVPRGHVRVQPSTGWAALNLGDIWRFRDLLVILAVRDIRLRYKQTALGVIWVILQPLIAALIFAVLFGRLARLPTDGIPYLLFAFTGLVGWNYFAGAVSRAGTSLVSQTNLITKVYFPRLVIPLSGVISALVDLSVSLVVAFILLALYHVPLTWRILALPAFVLALMILAVGVSLWLSALAVYYRDFVHAMPFLIQVWMYASPVLFSISIVPAHWRWAYALNPAVLGIEGIRWALLGTSMLDVPMVGAGLLSTVLVFFSGLFFFRRVERTFADVI